MRFLIILLTAITAVSAAELSEASSIKRDYDLILKNIKLSEKNQFESDEFTLKNSSELKTASSGLIRLYQVLISSQDSPACNFTPSCSRFTSTAIRKAGLFKGSLLGADRLLRCHRWTKRYYMKINNLRPDQVPAHIIDPPQKYID